MDRLSKKQRSALMAKVRIKDTDIEKILGEIIKPLWKIERYVKNVKNLPGKPDAIFPKSKIVIFVDGDFWHGRKFKKWDKRIPDFWKRKITLNIKRDSRQTRELRKLGYRVLRFWGSVIKKHPERVEAKIAKHFNLKKKRY